MLVFNVREGIDSSSALICFSTELNTFSSAFTMHFVNPVERIFLASSWHTLAEEQPNMPVVDV